MDNSQIQEHVHGPQCQHSQTQSHQHSHGHPQQHSHGHSQGHSHGHSNQGHSHDGHSHEGHDHSKKQTIGQYIQDKYSSLEYQLYIYSWQVVAALSIRIEKGFYQLQIKNKHYFFFIRGAYPFYAMSSFFMLTYFLFYTDEDFQLQWYILYFSTFILKFLFTILLCFIKPVQLDKNEHLEKYISECRMDLSRYKCPKENITVCFRLFHCNFCQRCCLKYEKHSYLVQRCIGSTNMPLYYLHVVADFVNSLIIIWAILLTFNERIDKDLVFFIAYLFCTFGHFGLFLKKLLVHTKSMLTNETLQERNLGFKLHYKCEKQLNMMERMQGQKPQTINPFNKGIVKNIIEFFLPFYTYIRCNTKPQIKLPPLNNLMVERKRAKFEGKDDSIEMIQQNTTIELDEEAKINQNLNENQGLLNNSLNQLSSDCERFGKDQRLYDIDYLIRNSPFKTLNKEDVVDWSRMRVFSLLQMPQHPSYEQMYNEIKKFMPLILQKEITQEKFRRGELNPQTRTEMIQQMQNNRVFVTPGGQRIVMEMNNQQQKQETQEHNEEKKDDIELVDEKDEQSQKEQEKGNKDEDDSGDQQRN